MKIMITTLLLVAACGGDDTDAGTDAGTISPVESHRETAVACPPGDGVEPDQCLVDADCGPERACACNGKDDHKASHHNVCVFANCLIDTDCGVAGFCSPSVGECANGFDGTTAYMCRTPDDECGTDADCGIDDNGYPSACSYSFVGERWLCVHSQCAG